MARQTYDAGNAFASFTNANTTGPGNEVVFSVGGGRELPYGASWQTVINAGTTTAINLEASLDGVNWAVVDSNTPAKAVEMRFLASQKTLMLRANITNMGTATAVSVFIIT